MITINGLNWGIRFVSPFNPNLHTSFGDQALGCCDNEKRIIYIAKGLSPIELKVVLYHELTHAVIFSYDIFMTKREEEKVAELISYYGDEINSLYKQIKRVIQ